MSNQIVISSGAKVRELEGVLTGTSGIVNALGINVPSGIPQLDGSGKILVSQLPNSVMEYKGSWNAATNTPTLVNGTGNAGDVYLCEVAGTVNFGAGPITFAVGDQVIYSGSIWQRASGATGTVTSVAVTESGDALTITGSPITTSGTINIGFAGTSGQYINGAGGLTTFPSLTGFVPYTGATAALDMGNNSITTSNFIFGKAIELDAGVEEVGGRVIFRQRAATSGGGANYTTFGAQSNNNVNFSFWQDAPSGINRYKFFTFSVDNLTLNVNRTYQMPDASGTLALTSNLSSYVPYTGATGDVNLGLFSIISNRVSAIGDNSTYGGTLSIKQNNVRSLLGTGYTELFGKTNLLGISFGVGSIANLSNSVLTAERTYTLPDATGTIALTSDLGGYVPYTGATNNVDLGSNYITSATIVFWKGTGSGLGNIGIGRIVPLGQNTTGQGNIGIGESSLFSNTTGSNNIAIGVSSTQANTTGINNIAIGLGSNSNNVTGSGNVALGVGALNFNTTNYNTAVGHLALYFNTTGANNVALGYASLYTNTTGSQNTALGSGTLYSNTTASNNTAIGNQALQQNTTGVNNTAIGSFSSYLNTTGQNNTSVGTSSLRNNTTGESNTAIGSTTLNNNTTGINNTGIGFAVLSNSTTASNNVAIGYASGVNISTGSNNTLVTGGSAITTGSNNTIIGNYAGTTTLANNIVLADGAGNIRYQFDGTNNIFTSNLNGTSASFASSGGSDTFAINHSSGSGIALNITKGGNGEGLYINKTSGTGNALTVIGSTSLGALSGTSATFASTAFTNLTLNGTNANGWGNNMAFQSGGTDFGYLGSIGSLLGNTTKDMTIWATSGNGFRVYTNGNNKQLEITTTGAATFSSSVTASNFLTNGAGGAGGQEALRINNDNGYIGFFNGSNTTRSGYLQGNTTDVTLTTSLSTPLIFGTANVEKMRITSGGNVGIGTSSPSQLLTVAGATSLAWTSAVSRLSIDRSGSVARFQNYDGGSAANISLAWDGGNVGIGTSSPSYTLDITGGGRYLKNNEALRLQSVDSNGNYMAFLFGTSAFAYIGSNYHLASGSPSANDLGIRGENNVIFLSGGSTERMRITSAGNLTIGFAASVDDCRVYIRGADTGGTNNGLLIQNSSGTNTLRVRNDGAFYTGVAANSPVNLTTGSAANVFVESGSGLLYRSTSSLKYKKNVQNYTKGLAEVMQMRPVYYKGKGENDGDKQFAGLIAEEVHELGLTEFVQYAEDGSPDALAYQNMIALAFKAIQELTQKVNELESKIK
jgi:hypothetical protein